VANVHCPSDELQALVDRLNQDVQEVGVGILHEPTGEIRLSTVGQVGGHDGLVQVSMWPARDCKGFVIGRNADGTFSVHNFSGLNGPQGQPGSLQMPTATFQSIEQALKDAGLATP